MKTIKIELNIEYQETIFSPENIVEWITESLKKDFNESIMSGGYLKLKTIKAKEDNG